MNSVGIGGPTHRLTKTQLKNPELSQKNYLAVTAREGCGGRGFVIMWPG